MAIVLTAGREQILANSIDSLDSRTDYLSHRAQERFLPCYYGLVLPPMPRPMASATSSRAVAGRPSDGRSDRISITPHFFIRYNEPQTSASRVSEAAGGSK